MLVCSLNYNPNMSEIVFPKLGYFLQKAAAKDCLIAKTLSHILSHFTAFFGVDVSGGRSHHQPRNFHLSFSVAALAMDWERRTAGWLDGL